MKDLFFLSYHITMHSLGQSPCRAAVVVEWPKCDYVSWLLPSKLNFAGLV